MAQPQTSTTIPVWTLADRLRKAREHAGLNQGELAEAAGIGRSTIVTYESGQSVPGKPVLIAWALVTGVDLEWLAGDTVRQPRRRDVANRAVRTTVPNALFAERPTDNRPKGGPSGARARRPSLLRRPSA